MVDIKPFKGLRPKAELAEEVASPPYDVLNSEEAMKMAGNNKFSFLHVVKPEIDLPPEISLYDAAVYEQGAKNLAGLRNDNVLVLDTEQCFYVYAQQMGEHRQFGLVAGASVDDYEADLIKKHELTRADKEKDRTRHVDALNANTGPVFLTYKATSSIDKLINKVTAGKPETDFVSDDEVRHTFWVVSDKNIIDSLKNEFKKISHLYVADGHHRSASACRVREMRKNANPNHNGHEEYNYFLSVIFPDDQLMIMAYNRVIKDLNNMDFDTFLNRISEKFEILKTKSKTPLAPKQFSLYSKQGWINLKAREGIFNSDDPVESLDVQIIQKSIFEPLLNISDPRRDERINFVGGIRGTKELEKLVNEDSYILAFSLFPTTIEQLMNIADAGKTMPPKSTWFEPKLRSGLVTHLL